MVYEIFYTDTNQTISFFILCNISYMFAKYANSGMYEYT